MQAVPAGSHRPLPPAPWLQAAPWNTTGGMGTQAKTSGPGLPPSSWMGCSEQQSLPVQADPNLTQSSAAGSGSFDFGWPHSAAWAAKSAACSPPGLPPFALGATCPAPPGPAITNDWHPLLQAPSLCHQQSLGTFSGGILHPASTLHLTQSMLVQGPMPIVDGVPFSKHGQGVPAQGPPKRPPPSLASSRVVVEAKASLRPGVHRVPNFEKSFEPAAKATGSAPSENMGSLLAAYADGSESEEVEEEKDLQAVPQVQGSNALFIPSKWEPWEDMLDRRRRHGIVMGRPPADLLQAWPRELKAYPEGHPPADPPGCCWPGCVCMDTNRRPVDSETTKPWLHDGDGNRARSKACAQTVDAFSSQSFVVVRGRNSGQHLLEACENGMDTNVNDEAASAPKAALDEVAGAASAALRAALATVPTFTVTGDGMQLPLVALLAAHGACDGYLPLRAEATHASCGGGSTEASPAGANPPEAAQTLTFKDCSTGLWVRCAGAAPPEGRSLNLRLRLPEGEADVTACTVGAADAVKELEQRNEATLLLDTAISALPSELRVPIEESLGEVWDVGTGACREGIDFSVWLEAVGRTWRQARSAACAHVVLRGQRQPGALSPHPGGLTATAVEQQQQQQQQQQGLPAGIADLPFPSLVCPPGFPPIMATEPALGSSSPSGCTDAAAALIDAESLLASIGTVEIPIGIEPSPTGARDTQPIAEPTIPWVRSKEVELLPSKAPPVKQPPCSIQQHAPQHTLPHAVEDPYWDPDDETVSQPQPEEPPQHLWDPSPQQQPPWRASQEAAQRIAVDSVPMKRPPQLGPSGKGQPAPKKSGLPTPPPKKASPLDGQKAAMPAAASELPPQPQLLAASEEHPAETVSKSRPREGQRAKWATAP
eukprot:CAMPEP_0172781474 /NCGR_PEP_ID=MMETSP1074-20121228/203446_1 /TAXON_ID=2916 /ORGANISM="Ceratium fusus, Strain PA161109" /LENGTH=883 /DNA_ID=CAMNT_0013618451 /DNA_START=158 /DNA_END=2806 /DNA_ORIENTATION=+